MKFDYKVNTDGSGYWSTAIREVTLTKAVLSYIDEEEGIGELQVYFDTGTWLRHDDGLIYTDNGFLRELQEKLASLGFKSRGIDYSEAGMQGNDFVSLDVYKDFMESWFKINSDG